MSFLHPFSACYKITKPTSSDVRFLVWVDIGIILIVLAIYIIILMFNRVAINEITDEYIFLRFNGDPEVSSEISSTSETNSALPTIHEEDIPEEDIPEEDIPEEDISEEDIPEEDMDAEDIDEEDILWEDIDEEDINEEDLDKEITWKTKVHIENELSVRTSTIFPINSIDSMKVTLNFSTV